MTMKPIQADICTVRQHVLTLKQESSGYPSWDHSEDDKGSYIQVYRRAEGIALDKASIFKNAGQRT